MSKSKSALIEKLNALYAKRNRLVGELEVCTVPVLRQLIKDEEATWICSACGGQLSILKWNEQVDIITCENSGCNSYRSPVGTIKK